MVTGNNLAATSRLITNEQKISYCNLFASPLADHMKNGFN
uniref:Uncharacterized protein n=1 Tax=Photorhabdus asymbiotica subsp. asymbiotica (strain ATCC 43949 / 3105-77) TaxID=553480 RepID=B6VKC7_PHOAA|nr:Hypothetical protein PA-RVA2-4269 [Photorhabdus asymbiotica subsp. asymbiotica ATCC 43949]